jgi:ribosomal protein L17
MKMKTKKSKMGRPSKGRDARILALMVRLSANERAAFEKKAKAARMPLSAWLIQPRRDELAKEREG